MENQKLSQNLKKIILINKKSQSLREILSSLNTREKKSVDLFVAVNKNIPDYDRTKNELEQLFGGQAICSRLFHSEYFIDNSMEYEGMDFFYESTAEIIVIVGNSKFLSFLQWKIGQLKKQPISISPISKGKIGMIRFELCVEFISNNKSTEQVY